MATCAQAIKEVFKDKNQILTTRQIIDAVKNKYSAQWKDVTIRTHTMGCSVNHSSSKYYPSFPKFLYTVSRGKVRLYDPEQDNIVTEGIAQAFPGELEEANYSEEEAVSVTLSLERDLQEYLSRDLGQLEPGLTLYTEDGLIGREVSTEAGKIDILAKDCNGGLVVIELKANIASYHALGQVLSYMASIKDELKSENVRGIIVAEDFDKKLRLAVTQVSNVSLSKYKVNFDFSKV